MPTGVDVVAAVAGGVLMVPWSSRSARPRGVCRRGGRGFAGEAAATVVELGAAERCKGSVGIAVWCCGGCESGNNAGGVGGGGRADGRQRPNPMPCLSYGQ